MKLNQLHSCPMKWEQMRSLDERTKFCQTCTKKIHDFSDASEEEVRRVMKGQTSICAKVPVSKLQELITPFQKVLLAMVICFSGTLFTVDFAYGQEVQKQEKIIYKASDWKILGVLVDSNTTETIIGAKVTAIEIEQYVQTDFDGRYEILIPEEVEHITLKFEFYGFKEKTVTVEKSQLAELGSVHLVELDPVYMEVDELELMMVGIIINIDPDSGYEKNSIEDLFQREKYLPGF